MFDNIKLSSINQKVVQRRKHIDQNNTNNNLKVSDNGLKQDIFAKSNKKAITFGSILTGVCLTVGAGFLAYKCKLDSKVQGFIESIVNKFHKISNNVSSATSKTTSATSIKTPHITPIGPVEELINDGEFDISLYGSSIKTVNKRYIGCDGRKHEIKLIIDDMKPPVCLVINDSRVGDCNNIESQILRIKQYSNGRDKEKISKRFGERIAEAYDDEIEKVQQDIVEKQYSLLKQCPSNPDEHFLYRGVHLFTENPQANEAKYSKLLLNAKKGDIIIPDWGITHTTTSAEWALDYALKKNINSNLSDALQQSTTKPALLRIHTPVGAKFYARHEDEIIFPCMANYRFLNKQEVGNLVIFDLEYIMPNLK